jgi:hypothetical protein
MRQIPIEPEIEMRILKMVGDRVIRGDVVEMRFLGIGGSSFRENAMEPKAVSASLCTRLTPDGSFAARK